MKKLFRLSAIAILLVAFVKLPLFAREPTNILAGFGIGAGQGKMSIEHSQIARYPTQAMTDKGFTAQRNSSLSSWALAWEFLVGYKHFLNDFVGFRYYGNIGIQHYKPISLVNKGQKIGFIDYTINADLLIDFWESELFAVGVLGGIGVGGTSFDRDAISKYLAVYDTRTGIPMGLADIQKHFLNINASVGFRFAVFQRVRRTGARICDDYVNGNAYAVCLYFT